jgi:lysyl-tRNA synthetase class II
MEYKETYEATRKLFTEIKAGKFKAYTSNYAYGELLEAPQPKRDKMLDLIKEYGIIQLKDTDEIDALALEYIKKEIIPQGSMLDAQHIACASINDIECIISVNFRHINRQKTKEFIPVINKYNDYNGGVTINTPMEVIDYDK